MSGFIRFIGSIFLFLWIAVTFLNIDFKGLLPEEYNNYVVQLTKNSWLLFVIGVVLSIVGAVTRVKRNRNKDKRSTMHKHRRANIQKTNDSGLLDEHGFANTDTSFVKKDFLLAQQKNKREQFVSKQQGQLKELALKVEWTPLRSGGANFKTSSLKRVSSSRLETGKSKGGMVFAGIFAIIGLGIMIGGTYSFYKDDGLSFELLIPLLFGLTFAGAGIVMLIWPRPRIFDLRLGWFWAGSKSLRREQEFNNLKQSTRLSEIAAIQVIAERISGNKGSSYTSWEINLISDDGQRLCVMDHGKKASIIEDAQFLGEFLGVPVWENS